MKIQEINIIQFQHNVKVITDVSCTEVKSIIEELTKINCPKELLDTASILFSKCDGNTGMTYSNNTIKESLIIIGKTSSKELFINTLSHEVYHFIELITTNNSIIDTEEKAKLYGNFFMQLTLLISDTLR